MVAKETHVHYEIGIVNKPLCFNVFMQKHITMWTTVAKYCSYWWPSCCLHKCIQCHKLELMLHCCWGNGYACSIDISLVCDRASALFLYEYIETKWSSLFLFNVALVSPSLFIPAILVTNPHSPSYHLGNITVYFYYSCIKSAAP
jgi:hypothetical protein